MAVLRVPAWTRRLAVTRAGVAVARPRLWPLPLRLPTEAIVLSTSVRSATSLEDVPLLHLCAPARALSPLSGVTCHLGAGKGTRHC